MCIVLILCSMLCLAAGVLCYAGPADGDPAGLTYDHHIMYQALAFFWIGIIGLIVIIIIKLKEIERLQDLDIDKEDEDAPFLD